MEKQFIVQKMMVFRSGKTMVQRNPKRFESLEAAVESIDKTPLYTFQKAWVTEVGSDDVLFEMQGSIDPSVEEHNELER